MNQMKTYNELIKFPTFLERYNYLKIGQNVGEETFGYNRYLNQVLYRSKEWRQFREKVISRDLACDLACYGHDIFSQKDILVHHINPISLKQVYQRDPLIFDMNNVVCTSLGTHNAIHYGSSDFIVTNSVIDRKKNDTCPWKDND